MNNLQRDQFIFNYLEGNLSKSEQDLFEEIKSSDSDFNDAFETWKKSYALKETPKDLFINKASLSPKRMFYKYYFFASVALISVLSYFLIKDNNQEEFQVKLVNRIETKDENSFVKHSSMEESDKENEEKIEKNNSSNKKKTFLPIPNAIAEKNDAYQDLSTIPTIETEEEEKPNLFFNEVSDSIKTSKEEPKEQINKTEKPIRKESEKPEKEKEKKPRKSFRQRMLWMKESFKNQVVIPVK